MKRNQKVKANRKEKNKRHPKILNLKKVARKMPSPRSQLKKHKKQVPKKKHPKNHRNPNLHNQT